MNIFDDYTSTIRTAMQHGSRRVKSFSSFDGTSDELRKAASIQNYLNESQENDKVLPSLSNLASTIGREVNYDQPLGSHPDFSHLKQTNTTERHGIVSLFIDIKNSTHLFKRYSDETIYIITNTIHKAAIHTSIIFGGYVQRLQGDGLFAYFGRRNESKEDSITAAMSAAGIFSYFVKNDLKDVFNEQGVETIYTRIGIDYGDANGVLWVKAGIGNICEVTTCSLHTSLASKMQSVAASNGVVVGENMAIEEVSKYLTPVAKRLGENERYAYRIQETNFYYTQYDFDWYNFLVSQSYIAVDQQSNLHLKQNSKHQSLSNLKPMAAQNKPYYGGS